ncbi:tRNA (N6-threonylcarbamoyladenosine(37)-N6)-methyltransferase TrmO [Anaerocolumna cellulosilytica]|uniref:tRNA (N6-threonylcarbamoyladenosine(37)-N6)-methyltransferase TrmO n=1 Tax=Anaerocolumna cellulosilytica TaxID=433286 RepID=A0A6S6RA55_9FIRM|nr:tRNA (N6-threonylcarbamoyladenosine(37)-N6)-methyltransferase TrmO [Anaerocolumna cellulosilytica]MBB5196778.1 tRNA-Thr(GGU) m(6)t(6)A37 methyltransferase TsaA [Anaerocolumna cellulosilytica]BCJ95828.1 tRNA (N6-threonylcarbamoyladenosine(37)-N6)-methyltransferase TrmO [Anaerocolumna cellulosilytica]
MNTFQVKPIGTIISKESETTIALNKEYIEGLRALDGFSHLSVIWWFSDYDSEEMRKVLETPQPYRQAPDVMGIFSTRSPIRPNPIALTTVQVIHINYEEGIIEVPYIDANNGTPVLDIKPYTPSLDRVEEPCVPKWCRHWPKSLEQSGIFNWEEEFLY